MKSLTHKNTNRIGNQQGQLVVEAVLLMTVLVGVTLLIQAKLKETKFLENLIAGPWSSMSGMIECGSWKSCREFEGAHPNTRNRNLSLDPKE